MRFAPMAPAALALALLASPAPAGDHAGSGSSHHAGSGSSYGSPPPKGGGSSWMRDNEAAASHAGSGNSAHAGSGSSHGMGSGDPRGVKQAIHDAVMHDQKLKGGYFLLVDRELNRVRALRLESLHDGVQKIAHGQAAGIARRARGNPEVLGGASEIYFGCADFKDVRSGDLLDVDVWVGMDGGELRPVQYLIHKVGKKLRFTYQPGELTKLE